MISTHPPKALSWSILILCLMTAINLEFAPCYAETHSKLSGDHNLIIRLPDRKLIEIQNAIEDQILTPNFVRVFEEQKKRIDFKLSNNQTWSELPVRSAQVQTLTRNPLTDYLRERLPSYASEAFVSNSNGDKVAFLSKPTYWNHSGKDKHEFPMAGKRWVGQVERDSSSGVYQIQISFPIKSENKILGSLVVGINIAKFKALESLKAKP